MQGCNIFREEEKKDRKYGAGGKLLENKGDKYSYDEEGNLIQKATQEGNWHYEWNGNGSLKQVTRPDNKTVSFEYDALGRRTAKIFDEDGALKNDLVNHFSDGPACRGAQDGYGTGQVSF
ncbi:RHS repeat domain-containing protein [Cytophagaceae bacterium ABcell3]|nr:RHS repeat domain-containing protein [Cytophagaceae bacterium ABcell3]